MRLNGQWTGYETLRHHPLGKFCGVNADHSRMDITMLCEKLRKLSPERLETVHPDVELHPNRLLEYLLRRLPIVRPAQRGCLPVVPSVHPLQDLEYAQVDGAVGRSLPRPGVGPDAMRRPRSQ